MPKLSEFPGLADRFGGHVLLALAFLVLVWKLVPAPTRAKIELAFPRVAGGARFLAAVLPDVIGALRVGWYQVLAGQPRASVQPPAAQPSKPPQSIEPEAPRARSGFLRAELLLVAAALAFAVPASSGPFAAVWVLVVLGVLVLALAASVLPRASRWLRVALACAPLALVLTGCPLPAPDHCTPGATRCSPQGKPQRCSSTAPTRWWSEPTTPPCASLGTVCCPAMSPYGNVVHSCVPQTACLPEHPAAGATSAPSTLAETQ